MLHLKYLRIRRYHFKFTDVVIEILTRVTILLSTEKNRDGEREERGSRKHVNFIIAHNRKLIGTV